MMAATDEDFDMLSLFFARRYRAMAFGFAYAASMIDGRVIKRR